MRRYTHDKSTFGEVKDFPALSVALENKVIADREMLFSKLKELTAELVCYMYTCSLLIGDILYA